MIIAYEKLFGAETVYVSQFIQYFYLYIGKW